MSQSGGGAAINGFLYQIILHIDWLAKATLVASPHDHELRNARIVLEPPGGGDAVAQSEDRYRVEQYKTRPVSRTWSIRDLIPVLTDLRKAAPQGLPSNAQYRFVTNGRPGRMHAFDEFLDDVKASADPQQLDNRTRRDYGKCWKNVTNREFFEDMERQTRSKKGPAFQSTGIAFHHVLSRFRMEFHQDRQSRAAAIDRLLRSFVRQRATERAVRERLVSIIMERISDGTAVFDPHEIRTIFNTLGLNPERVRRFENLHSTLGTLTQRRLADRRYDAARDVRPAPEWMNDKPVLLITGESGAGKTWQLYRLLTATADESRIATLVPAAKSHEQLLTAAASDLAQRGLGDSSNPGIVEVSEMLRELNPDGNTPRALIALDDIRDPDVVRDLVRQDWTDWDMALALTVPNHVARALEYSDPGTFALHPVLDFTIDELDQYLDRCARQWSDLPPDLRSLLRKPILAGTFVDIPHDSFQTTPRTEYEILETFWTRIAEKGKPGDEGLVLALADRLVAGSSSPLARPAWLDLALNEDSVTRLAASGWVTCSDLGEVEFAHDRLLNWAAAKSLAHRFSAGRLNVEDIWASFKLTEKHSPSRFGYVPMDVLWLLAASESNAAPLARFLELLEDHPSFHADALYPLLVPTIGTRAGPVLIERLALLTGTPRDYRPTLIARSFRALAHQPDDRRRLQDVIQELLAKTSPVHQNAALAFLEVLPQPTTLPRLWQIHQQRHAALASRADYPSATEDYHASFSALRAGTPHDPAWLRCRILRNAAERTPAAELAYLLNALDHADAEDIWRDAAHHLFASVPEDKPRSLLLCIARFRDHSRVEFVVQHLSTTSDSANTAALTALTILDPKRAIQRLADVDDFDRYLSRGRWLPFLLRSHPALVHHRIRRIAETGTSTLRPIVELFGERVNQVDPSTLRTLLRSLKRMLRDDLQRVLTDVPPWLDRAIHFLAGIARLDLIAVLQAETEGELEQLIAEVACSRLRSNSNRVDHVVENARRVLVLTAGDALNTLIRREVESPHYWVRYAGLQWAWSSDDRAIIEQLVLIATRPLPPEVRADPLANHLTDVQRQSWFEFADSTKALAAHSADTELVGLLQETRVVDVVDDLPRLRAHAGPIPERLTDDSRCVLQNVDSAEDEILTALLIARISGDDALIPLTRTVLKRVPPHSAIAMHACFALQALGDSSDEFVHLARKLLDTQANRRYGLLALLGLGGRGCAVAADWFDNTDRTSAFDLPVLVTAIRALHANSATKPLALKLAVRLCRDKLFPIAPPYDIAAESLDPVLRPRIIEEAFATDTGTPTATLRAIEGLVKFDVAKAISACKHALQHAVTRDTKIPDLLLRIAPATAPGELFAIAVANDRKPLRESIGRALRHADSAVVSDIVTTALHGSKPERMTAAQMAAWLPTPDIAAALRSRLDDDRDMEVRRAVLDALDAHDREADILALLHAFPASNRRRRWCLLVSILESGDPFLLSDPTDDLWLGHVLADAPNAFALHSKRRLQIRKNSPS